VNNGEATLFGRQRAFGKSACLPSLLRSFGGIRYALSASSLSQADMPFAPAFLRYMAFSVAVQRKCTCLVPLSLAGKGGLPRFLGVMGRIIGLHKISLQSPKYIYILSTH
jgi:hypothetical protein